MGKKHKIETIPFEAKVRIDIPGSFYSRIQQLVVHYSNSRPNDELVAAMKKLSGKEQASTEFEYHVQTLTILLYEIESKAKEQGVTKMEEIEIPESGVNES